ncbi:hypothetical protein BY996DRAFT_4131435 [Phakopsora pachyrhizi]|nr:hypothetical protein BY996DRAFT_4131435 [Phakopsora pachyrhizi]
MCTISPLFYNLFFISFPIIIAIFHFIIIHSVVASLAHHSEAWFSFIDAIHLGSLMWEQLISSHKKKSYAGIPGEILEINQRVEELGLNMLSRSNHIISKFKFAWIFWASVMFVTFMILASSLWNLFFSIRTKISKSEMPITENSTLSMNMTPLSKTLGTRDHPPNALKKRLHNLSIRGGVMLFSILITYANVMIGATQAEEMATMPPLKSLMDWLPLVSGTAAAIPITFQCRMYTR